MSNEPQRTVDPEAFEYLVDANNPQHTFDFGVLEHLLDTYRSLHRAAWRVLDDCGARADVGEVPGMPAERALPGDPGFEVPPRESFVDLLNALCEVDETDVYEGVRWSASSR
jgi:hypothetical protein